MNHFSNISDFTQALGIKPPEHPLFSILHGNKSDCGGIDVNLLLTFISSVSKNYNLAAYSMAKQNRPMTA